MIRSSLRRTSFLLFRGNCLLCGDATHRAADLCFRCERELPCVRCACWQCGEMLAGADAGTRCLPCIEKPPTFQRTYAHFVYQTPVDRMMNRFKERGQLSIGHTMAELTAKGFARSDSALPELLIPIPLTRRRRRQRGFNQAELVAGTLASTLGIPVSHRLLARRIDRATQKSASRRERLAQVAGVFNAQRSLEGCHAGLVDDVVTTGATAEAAARALIAAGARRVTVIALARTPPPGQ